ncbi:MAG: amino acid adenylation domain-containing protein, partial [Psychrosphaera sp.]|nr:amino acid adenylation domain-containing protein [Psychrosphaera sp.]
MATLSGQQDVVVGTPSDNRDQPQSQGLIGFFVNSLALRTQVDASLSISELIQQVHQLVLGAKSQQQLPFEKLVELLKVERDASRHPIFQVMFGLQGFNADSDEGHDTAQWPFTFSQFSSNSSSSAKFDLSLFVDDSTEQISANFNYALSLFEPASIAHMAAIYQCILVAFAEQHDLRIGDIDSLPPVDRRLLLEQWCGQDQHYADDQTLAQMFERQVDKTPDAIAVIFAQSALSYRQLDQQANRLARVISQDYLARQGQQITPNTLIGLYLERSLEMVISLLAVLKTGAAYVPIVPGTPQQRVQFIVEESNAALIVSQQRYLAQLSEWLGDSVGLIAADNRHLSQSMSNDRLPPVANAGSLAYVIYTSGTTGKPKGVMVAHQGVVNRIEWGQAQYPLQKGDRVLQKTPLGFDVSVWELFWANWYGATLVVAAPDSHKDPQLLHQTMLNQQITVVHFVPSMLALYTRYLSEHQLTLPSSLKRVFCSGEALNVEQCQQFNHLRQAHQLVHNREIGLTNLYGPTEASIEVSYFDIEVQPYRTIPIGKPIANTRLYILNASHQPVPIGTPGELYIGGAGVALGYLNRPQLSEQAFINNPFATKADKARGYHRLYKSGDLARFNADGNIEYLGRNDGQIKIRGHRIEIGEIQSVLNQMDEVAQAVVIVLDYKDNQYLAAYLVGHSIGEKRGEQLREKLVAQLPDYMIPSTFTWLDSMPLSQNGKIDSQALPQPMGESDLAPLYRAPRNTLERQVCILWQALLSVDKVGIDDDFFQLGGHSLLIHQLVLKLKKLNISISLQKFYQAPTIAGLMNSVRQQSETQQLRQNQPVT